MKGAKVKRYKVQGLRFKVQGFRGSRVLNSKFDVGRSMFDVHF